MYIYILSSFESRKENKYKIGYTTNTHNRLMSLRTSIFPTEDSRNLLTYDYLFKQDVKVEIELKKIEQGIHIRFQTNRLFHMVEGDSEWFKFDEGLSSLVDYIKTMKGSTEVKYDQTVEALKPPMMFDHKISTDNERFNEITSLQEEYINTITSFIQDKSKSALTVVAACGFGKTTIAVKSSIYDMIYVIISPSKTICYQWDQRLRQEYPSDYIVYGKNDKIIKSFFESTISRKFIIITTYSSHSLLNYIEKFKNNIICIYDEAHHMADDQDTMTRLLLHSVITNNVKRLFLTFTPKNCQSYDDEKKVHTMEDNDKFGEIYYPYSYRELVQRKLFPKFICWNSMIDDVNDDVNVSLSTMVYQCFKCWNAKNNDNFVINKLLIYAKEHKYAKQIYDYFINNVENEDELIICNQNDKSNDIRNKINQFTHRKRCILINCKVLGEGVDIPCVDSVCIMYRKTSMIETTQMVLRPGRWYPGKDVFYILTFNNGCISKKVIDELVAGDYITGNKNYGVPTGNKKSSIKNKTEDDDVVIEAISEQKISFDDILDIKKSEEKDNRTVQCSEGGSVGEIDPFNINDIRRIYKREYDMDDKILETMSLNQTDMNDCVFINHYKNNTKFRCPYCSRKDEDVNHTIKDLFVRVGKKGNKYTSVIFYCGKKRDNFKVEKGKVKYLKVKN
jgi:superfamily II DNA or RNA helicase